MTKPEPDGAKLTLSDLLAGGAHDAAAQTIRVTATAWKTVLAKSRPNVWNSLEARESVDRAWVRSFQDAPALDLLAASMVWGFGPISYGPFRVREMLTTRGADQSAEAIRADLRDGGPEKGFASLFAKGRPRLRYLGVAFGTKFLAFATDPDRPTSAYVYDKNVWKGLKLLAVPPTQFADPGGYVRATQYRDYCAWISKHAAIVGFAHGEDLELALFRLGRNPR